jgi:hypothetical protein
LLANAGFGQAHEDRTMNQQNVRAFVRAVPFHPFYVKMADGTVHVFHHPEMIIVGKVAAYALAPNGVDLSILDLSLMTEAGNVASTAEGSVAH